MSEITNKPKVFTLKIDKSGIEPKMLVYDGNSDTVLALFTTGDAEIMKSRDKEPGNITAVIEYLFEDGRLEKTPYIIRDLRN